MIFNSEIMRRLRDLHGAEEAKFARRDAYAGVQHRQPECVDVRMEGGRRFALSLALALQAADQLEANGQAEKAAALREAAQ